MKPIEEIREFKLEIPNKEIVKILQEAGYEIPNDANLFTWDYGDEKKLVITWTRKQ